jgi:hypothetical protein
MFLVVFGIGGLFGRLLTRTTPPSGGPGAPELDGGVDEPVVWVACESAQGLPAVVTKATLDVNR